MLARYNKKYLFHCFELYSTNRIWIKVTFIQRSIQFSALVLKFLCGFDHVQKKKGSFQHSSFLAGGAITAAGRLVVKDGILKVCSHGEQYYIDFYTTIRSNIRDEQSFVSSN